MELWSFDSIFHDILSSSTIIFFTSIQRDLQINHWIRILIWHLMPYSWFPSTGAIGEGPKSDQCLPLSLTHCRLVDLMPVNVANCLMVLQNYLCWCWWWETCWQQFVADLEAEAQKGKFLFRVWAQALKLNALGLMCLWEWFLILDLKVLFPLESSFTTPTTHGLSWTCVFESFICKPWITLVSLETSQYSFLLETIACCLWWH